MCKSLGPGFWLIVGFTVGSVQDAGNHHPSCTDPTVKPTINQKPGPKDLHILKYFEQSFGGF
jgi:hypothetical protein